MDDAEAVVVRRIFREFATGKSPRAIATNLNRDGIPGPFGRCCHNSPSTIRGSPWRGSVQRYRIWSGRSAGASARRASISAFCCHQFVYPRLHRRLVHTVFDSIHDPLDLLSIFSRERVSFPLVRAVHDSGDWSPPRRLEMPLPREIPEWLWNGRSWHEAAVDSQALSVSDKE